MRRASLRAGLLATACLLVACQVGKPTVGRPAGTRPSPPAATGPSASPAGLAASPGALGAEPLRLLGQGLAQQVLAGEVRLLSDHGGGLISDQGGGIISNNSGAIVSNNSGAIVSNNSGAIVSNPSGALRALAQAEAAASLASFRLAEAQVEVWDAAGQRLAGPDGKALVATTDAQGRYRLAAGLPAEGLVLRVKLFNGGELVGLLPKARAPELSGFDLDPERSLGSRYVLDRIAPSRPNLLDAVDGPSLERVRQAIQAAGVAKALGPKPDYGAAAQVALAQRLRALDACVDEAFAAIERLVGQAGLGDGQKALDVPLVMLGGLAEGPKGQLYVYEGLSRLREVAGDGLQQVVAGLGSKGTDLYFTSDLDALADGSLLFTESWDNRVSRLSAGPDGVWKHEVVLGAGAASGLALKAPQALGVAPDGTVVVAETASSSAPLPFWRWDLAAQRLEPLPGLPRPWGRRGLAIRDLAVEPGGAVVVALEPSGSKGGESAFWRLNPGKANGSWALLQDQVEVERSFVVAEGGELWWPDDRRQVVWHRKADGQVSVFAGQDGQVGDSGDGGPATSARFQKPGELLRAADGSWYVADDGNGVVRRIDAQGRIATAVGRRASGAVGDLNGLAISMPFGLAASDDGQSLLVAEFASNTLKRLRAGQAELFAGGVRGFDGDGEGFAQVAFDGVSGVASDRLGGFVVVDLGNRRVRRLDAQGRVSTLAGPTVRKANGANHGLGTVTAVACSPDGSRVYWADTDGHYIGVVGRDGQAQVLAGKPGESGDAPEGALASEAKISGPFGLAVAPDGTIYFSEQLNMRVRAIAPDGRMRTVAGLPGGLAASLLAAQDAAKAEGPATGVPLVMPGPLAIAPDGALVVAEWGTAKLGSMRKIGLRYAFAFVPTDLPQLNARIARIDLATGRLSALAGRSTGALESGENQLYLPLGLAIAPDGRVAVADALANQIWALRYGAGASCAAP